MGGGGLHLSDKPACCQSLAKHFAQNGKYKFSRSLLIRWSLSTQTPLDVSHYRLSKPNIELLLTHAGTLYQGGATILEI